MTKKELLEALKQAGVSRVKAEYDGSGDEGLIHSVNCYGPNGDGMHITDALRQTLEGVLSDILDAERGGWELDDGSLGEVEVDVATGAAKFSHTWRVMDYEDEEFETSLRGGE